VKTKRAGNMAQVVKHLPSKHEALNTKISSEEERKEEGIRRRKRKEGEGRRNTEKEEEAEGHEH
jgi:hypothetical protein